MFTSYVKTKYNKSFFLYLMSQHKAKFSLKIKSEDIYGHAVLWSSKEWVKTTSQIEKGKDL